MMMKPGSRGRRSGNRGWNKLKFVIYMYETNKNRKMKKNKVNNYLGMILKPDLLPP